MVQHPILNLREGVEIPTLMPSSCQPYLETAALSGDRSMISGILLAIWIYKLLGITANTEGVPSWSLNALSCPAILGVGIHSDLWWLSGKRIYLQCRRLPALQETWVRSLGQEDRLEGVATHSSVFAWEISCGEKTSGSQSIGLKEFDMT